MALLSIQLQDGFKGDTVVIHVNDEIVFDEKEVQTKLLYGLADSRDVSLKEKSADVRVNLPERHLSDSFTLPLDGDTYLAISIEDDEIRHFISATPFGCG